MSFREFSIFLLSKDLLRACDSVTVSEVVVASVCVFMDVHAAAPLTTSLRLVESSPPTTLDTQSFGSKYLLCVSSFRNGNTGD